MAYNDTTTYGEILALGTNVLADNDVFKIKKRELARIFLRRLLEPKDDASDSELEVSYKACFPKKEVPENSEDFWVFIEKEYLNLEDEPKRKFMEISFRVHEDLVALTKNLKYIRQEQKSLEEKKRDRGRLTADERYYRNQLEYFEKKNLVAKDEIVDFMADGIKWWCIRKASVNSPFSMSFGSSIIGDSPYDFGRRTYRNSYDVNSLDNLSNKFTDLPASGYSEVIRECRSSPEKFKEIAIAYIDGFPGEWLSVAEKIQALIEKSHILASRKTVVLTMLQHFKAKDYISFVSMAPLQIEGIFSDICREIGVSEVQLDISSLNEKLQHIDEKVRSFFFFEYYSFKFPVLRNLIAHGGLVDGELEDTAIQLMLDLLPVCNLTVSKDLPIVHALEVLREAARGTPKRLVEWIDLRNSVKIPDFYNIHEEIKKVEVNFTLQEFWDHLQSELNGVDAVEKIKNSKPMKVAGEVKRAGLAVEQADKFLKSSGRIASEAIGKRKEMLEKVRELLKSKAKEPSE